MISKKLIKAILVLLLPVLIVVILYYAKEFLMPLTFAGLLSVLLLPITQRLEKRKVNKTLSALAAVLVFVFLSAGVVALITWQASGITENVDRIEERISSAYSHFQQYIRENLSIPTQKQKQIIQKQQASATGKVAGVLTGLISNVAGLLATTLLVLVYTFLLIIFRGHIKRFILKVAGGDKNTTKNIFGKIKEIIQAYLAGYGAMIVGLWIMYGIGFWIAGIKSPVLFAILCGLLEIVPFVGNLSGTGITIIAALVQGGGLHVVIGIIITYALVQFIQSYILSPLVVGHEVNINPLFTIVGLIAAEAVWGIGGMVVAIPLMGIMKIMFDNINALQPYGEFMGEEKTTDDNIKEKLKAGLKKITQRFKKINQ